MRRKLPLQLSAAFLRCLSNSTVWHLRLALSSTVPRYGTGTISGAPSQLGAPDLRPICKWLGSPLHNVQLYSTCTAVLVYRYGTVLLYTCTSTYRIYVPSAIESFPFSLRTYVPPAAGGGLTPNITVLCSRTVNCTGILAGG